MANTVTLRIDLTDEFIHDVMTSTVESGGHAVWYWAQIFDVERDDDLNVLSFKVRLDDDVHDNMLAGTVLEYNAGKVVLGIQRLINGLDSQAINAVRINSVLMECLVRAIKFMDAGDVDAEVADCIAQAALLDGIVFS